MTLTFNSVVTADRIGTGTVGKMKTEPENDMTKTHEPEEENTAVLSERSPIRLGLILGLFSFAVVVMGAAWYLATALAKIETKLDSIVAEVRSNSASTSSLERKQIDHERDDQNSWRAIETRVAIIERSGTAKTEELENKLTTLENEFKVYQAVNRRTGNQNPLQSPRTSSP